MRALIVLKTKFSKSRKSYKFLLTSFVIVTNEVSNRSIVGTAPSLAKKNIFASKNLKLRRVETYVANLLPTLQTQHVRVGIKGL